MPAVRGSHPEYFLRPALLDIFRRKEAREIMTNNLFASVTFDSFGASVPTNNQPLWIQHEDRIVLEFVEEHPIFFFAIPKRFLRRVGSICSLRGDFTRSVSKVEGLFLGHATNVGLYYIKICS